VIAAILLLVAGAAAPPAPGPGQTAERSFGIARLRLEGPCSGAWVEAGGPSTQILADLAAGEVLHVSVPLAGPLLSRPGLAGPGALEAQAGALPEPAGSARIVGWDLELQSLPPVTPVPQAAAPPRAHERLARRPRPPLAPARPQASGADLALVGALLLAGLALRRRPAALLLLGGLGAALVWYLPQPASPDLEVRVIEGDLAAGAWIEVRAGLGALTIEPGEPVRPTLRPDGCEPRYEVDLREAVPRWRVLASGCEISMARALGAVELSLDHNGLGRLDPLWTRSADGRWERRGPWAPGAALPAGAPEPGEGPPAWLAAALPQGRGVLVGVLEGRPEMGWTRTWVRVLGP
jgi:hypothetical protein